MTSAYLISPGVPSPSIVNGEAIRVTEYWPQEIACQIESIRKMVVVVFCFFFFFLNRFFLLIFKYQQVVFDWSSSAQSWEILLAVIS